MPKVVAIPNNLEQIGRELDARGYEVVHDKYDGYVDAILYDSRESSLAYLNNYDNVLDMERGAIVVDVHNKGLRDIIYAIEHRSYEGLF
ncbi:MAG: YkuS family protein [Anaeromicrobium sp.]|jgi:hypothetical protein|uniref:YkuS family protein n=1 Tax=Anaeromicrobium sp. TaxID=1929132 RepID=UPI0025F1836C|nr:YkuS family protein [Anaeromicrobium sp.]MCT4592953.1 YkuS family protein [Anaeromicrobium sp.]